MNIYKDCILKAQNNSRPLITAGFLLGVGMGGFVDGILFHQILQFHHMVSNVIVPDTLVNADINMFWDGLFDAFTWTMTLLGVMLLWKAVKNETVPKLTQVFIGSGLIGCGAFNLIEGIIDHHIFKLHHVIQNAVYPDQLYWDLVFLASGIVLIVLGYYLIQFSLRKAYD
jgi:uncharacterized membrane protein